MSNSAFLYEIFTVLLLAIANGLTVGGMVGVLMDIRSLIDKPLVPQDTR